MLFLLLGASLLPLAALGVFSHWAAERMGLDLAGRGAQVLEEKTEASLREKARDFAFQLESQQRLMVAALRLQARGVEALLAKAPRKEADAAWAEAFDQGRMATETSPQYFLVDENGKRVPQPVSFSRPVFYLPAGVPPGKARGDLDRLAGVGEIYRQAREVAPFVHWQYTALENGLHSAYPGHGGYPAGYDPRRRPWYVAGRKSHQPVGVDASVDASSRRVILGLAMPVFRPGGALAGVTAMDVAVDQLLSPNNLEPGWARSAHVMLVSLAEGNGAPYLRVFAQSDAGSARQRWDLPLEDVRLESPGALPAFRAASAGGAESVFRLPYRGEASLWCVVPMDEQRKHFITLVVPLRQVLASAVQAREYVWSRTQWQSRITLAAGLVVALLAAVLAFFRARSLTRPLAEMADTAHAIAHGDLASRVELGERRDEVGELGEAVNRMASSIESLLREQDEAHLEMMESLSKALEARDAYTARHSSQVANFSVRLGERLGLSPAELEILRRGAMLHDLGKIGVRDNVLNKAERLSEQEFAEMRRHAGYTNAIMRPLTRFRAFAEIAAWHHERWDGKGYPDGLKGEAIPLLARIVAIADSWDAMTGDRVYRQGMPVEQALAILRREQDGGQWDPRLVREFIAMIEEDIARQAPKDSTAASGGGDAVQVERSQSKPDIGPR
ncbi:MAG: HD domain-containing phosphohydrolase [Sulfuricellaceae bacterium]|jgi:HD-GYP domain-containing protein (c-di-GMP phosphodiesterase class II)